MNALWQWIFAQVERMYLWAVVMPNEKGIRTLFGCWPKVVGPGLRWTLPVFGRLVKLDVTEQVVDVRSQSLTTKDDITVAVGISIAYEVLDPFKAYYRVHDLDQSLANESLRVVGELVGESMWDGCRYGELGVTVLKDLRDIATTRWGLKILRVGLSDFAEHKALRVMGIDRIGANVDWRNIA